MLQKIKPINFANVHHARLRQNTQVIMIICEFIRTFERVKHYLLWCKVGVHAPAAASASPCAPDGGLSPAGPAALSNITDVDKQMTCITVLLLVICIRPKLILSSQSRSVLKRWLVLVLGIPARLLDLLVNFLSGEGQIFLGFNISLSV